MTTERTVAEGDPRRRPGRWSRAAAIGAALLGVTTLAAVAVGTESTGVAAATADPRAPFGSVVISLPPGVTAQLTPAPTATAAPTPTAGPAAAPVTALDPDAAPVLKIALTYQRRNRDLLVKLVFDGAVYLPYTFEGNPAELGDPADRTIGLTETLKWGDGTSYQIRTGLRCAKREEPQVLRAVKDSYELRKKYTLGGEYTLAYVFEACGLSGGQVAGTLKIRVP